MKLRMLLELETREARKGIHMPDWIDDLKKQEVLMQEAQDKQEQMRLHTAKVIAAKLPGFWDATINSIRQDCQRLRDTFPNTRQRHCHVDTISDTVAIVNEGPLPRLEMRLRLNLDGQCIDVFDAVKSDMFRQPDECGPRRIDVTLDQHEQLQFRYGGKNHNTPESLAQAFVSYVCKI